MAWVSCECLNLPPWRTVDEWPPKGATVVGLTIDGTGEPAADQLAFLTPAERQRADRYRQRADRLRFLYGRLLLRWVSYRLTGQPVALTTGPYGKPDFPADLGWHINLSHAGDWVLMAIDRTPVGVDVESYRLNLLLDMLLLRTCNRAEQAWVRASENPDAAFRQLWTRKEALLKATGRGLIDHLDTVPSLDGRAAVPAAIDTSAVSWRVLGFAVDPVHPAALAYQFREELPAFYQLTASDLLTY